MFSLRDSGKNTGSIQRLKGWKKRGAEAETRHGEGLTIVREGAAVHPFSRLQGNETEGLLIDHDFALSHIPFGTLK